MPYDNYAWPPPPSGPSAQPGDFGWLFIVDVGVTVFMVLGPSLAGYAGWGLYAFVLIGLILGSVLVDLSRSVQRAASVVGARTLVLHGLAWVAMAAIGYFLPDSDDVGTGSLYTASFGALHDSPDDALRFTGTAAAYAVGALLLMAVATTWSLSRDKRRAAATDIGNPPDPGDPPGADDVAAGEDSPGGAPDRDR